MGNEVLPVKVQRAFDVIYHTQGISMEDIQRQDRRKRIVACRQWVAYFLFTELCYTKREIGEFINHDRCSAYACVTRAEGLLKVRDKLMLNIKKSFMEVWKSENLYGRMD